MTKSKYQNKPYACCIVCVLLFGFLDNTYALDLDKVKSCFLSGDYKAAIIEGEKILAESEEVPELDELYYLLGLSYLKDGNFLRATDIFEIILNEFKSSALREEATLGLGDAYFLTQDFEKAQHYYQESLLEDKNSMFLPSIYYRLGQCALKAGKTQEAKTYLDILQEKYPGYAQIGAAELAYPASVDFYTVQVGSFSKKANADRLAERLTDRLAQKLTVKGMPAYVEENCSSSAVTYRVRVGKFVTRQEAVEAAARLSQEGYPARIFP